MSRQRIQTFAAAGVVAVGAVIVWAISSLDSVRDVHPRFPMAAQVFGVYLFALAPQALLPTPLPSLGRLGLWNALGIGAGGLIIGASRSGALMAIPMVCIGIALALWPPVPHPETDRVPAAILTIGGALAVLLPAAWEVYM
ncbi:MAG TPA: hypothetical protein VD789_12765 [Thermomicrobiales bacterium]|nr:hypothetical protein [Thermomicrobiales bacterium]